MRMLPVPHLLVSVLLGTIVLMARLVQLLMHLYVQLDTFALPDHFNLLSAHKELIKTKQLSLNASPVLKDLSVIAVLSLCQLFKEDYVPRVVTALKVPSIACSIVAPRVRTAINLALFLLMNALSVMGECSVP